jgi:hypothetical protein
MQRKHFRGRSAHRSVKVEHWLDNSPEARAISPTIPGSMSSCTAFRGLVEEDLPQVLARMHSQWLAGRSLEAFFEMGRLRVCPVCNEIFSAFRRDAACCSRKCSHIRRQHRFTGNWDRYKRARAFRIRTGLSAVKGKERRRLVELNKVLRATEPEDDADR